VLASATICSCFAGFAETDSATTKLSPGHGTYFPDTFQQLGAIAAGSFFERNHPNGFT